MESLLIHVSTFESECMQEVGGDPSASPSENDSNIFYGFDFSQAHLLGNLLRQAQNLRELALERFHPLVLWQPEIGAGLTSMRRLSSIRLSSVCDSDMSVVQSLQSDIRRLTLSYHVQDDDPYDDPSTMPPLLTALSAFQNLHTVKLWNFKPSSPLAAHDSSYTPPLLPSVRYLRLSLSSGPALDIVGLCPDLSTLIFSVDPEEGLWTVSTGPRWGALQRVMLAEPDEIACVEDRLGKVDVLQISRELNPPGSSSDVPPAEGGTSQLVRLLRATSPLGLYLSLFVGSACLSSMTLWKALPTAAPRLKSLELKLTYHRLAWHLDEDQGEGGLEELPDVLRPLSLTILKIFVPALPGPGPAIIPMLSASDSFDDQRTKAAIEAAQKRERHRVRMLAALPRRLVDAIPSLCYLALSDMAENPALIIRDECDRPEDDTPDTRGAESISEPEADAGNEGQVICEWDELRRVDHVVSQRWWRVLHEKNGRKLVEISEAEGERAQRAVEVARIDTISEMKDAFASLSL